MNGKLIGVVALTIALMPPAVAAADELSDAYAAGLESFRAESYDDALPHFKRALSLAEARFGADDPRIAVELNNLAEVYRLQGDLEKAETLYLRVIELDKQALAADSPDLATSLNNLALLYRAQDRLDEAEKLYEQSLAILQGALGHHHPKVAKSLNNLAVLYNAQGRSADARELLDRAVAVAIEELGPEHPTTVTLQRNLASIEATGDAGTVLAANLAATAIEPAAGGSYLIHLASVRDRQAATAEWRRLAAEHQLPASIPQRQPIKVTTASGDFYRVWGGNFASLAEADAVCAAIRSKGDYCKAMGAN